MNFLSEEKKTALASGQSRPIPEERRRGESGSYTQQKITTTSLPLPSLSTLSFLSHSPHSLFHSSLSFSPFSLPNSSPSFLSSLAPHLKENMVVNKFLSKLVCHVRQRMPFPRQVVLQPRHRLLGDLGQLPPLAARAAGGEAETADGTASPHSGGDHKLPCRVQVSLS